MVFQQIIETLTHLPLRIHETTEIKQHPNPKHLAELPHYQHTQRKSRYNTLTNQALDYSVIRRF